MTTPPTTPTQPEVRLEEIKKHIPDWIYRPTYEELRKAANYFPALIAMVEKRDKALAAILDAGHAKDCAGENEEECACGFKQRQRVHDYIIELWQERDSLRGQVEGLVKELRATRGKLDQVGGRLAGDEKLNHVAENILKFFEEHKMPVGVADSEEVK